MDYFEIRSGWLRLEDSIKDDILASLEHLDVLVESMGVKLPQILDGLSLKDLEGVVHLVVVLLLVHVYQLTNHLQLLLVSRTTTTTLAVRTVLSSWVLIPKYQHLRLWSLLLLLWNYYCLFVEIGLITKRRDHSRGGGREELDVSEWETVLLLVFFILVPRSLRPLSHVISDQSAEGWRIVRSRVTLIQNGVALLLLRCGVACVVNSSHLFPTRSLTFWNGMI